MDLKRLSKILVIFFLGSQSQADLQAISCEQLLSISQILNLDSQMNRRAYYQFWNQLQRSQPMVTVTTIDSQGKTKTIPTPNTLQSALAPQKLITSATMGTLGKLYDFKWDPTQKKMIPQENAFWFDQIKKETLDLLSRPMSQDISLKVERLIADSLPVHELTPTTVMVTASLVSLKSMNGASQALLHRFQNAGMAVVDFIYRDSKLESTKALVGFVMRDEIIDIINQGRGYNIHLVYDKQVWEKEVQLIARYYEDYLAASTPEEQKKILDKISNSSAPFLPFTGVVSTEHPVSNTKPIELKRYFKNLYEDPLALSQKNERPDFQLRHKMLYQVISQLPQGCTLEIHAHSLIHKNAYQKLGFHEYSRSENSLYPGVTVYVLQATKEEVLKKIKAIIDRTEVID